MPQRCGRQHLKIADTASRAGAAVVARVSRSEQQAQFRRFLTTGMTCLFVESDGAKPGRSREPDAEDDELVRAPIQAETPSQAAAARIPS